MALRDSGFAIFGCQILTDLPEEQMRSADDVSDEYREAIVAATHELACRRHVAKYLILSQSQVVALPGLEYDLLGAIQVADLRSITFLNRENTNVTRSR